MRSCSRQAELKLHLVVISWLSIYHLSYLSGLWCCMSNKNAVNILLSFFQFGSTQLWAWHWIRFSIFTFNGKWLEVGWSQIQIKTGTAQNLRYHQKFKGELNTAFTERLTFFAVYPVFSFIRYPVFSKPKSFSSFFNSNTSSRKKIIAGSTLYSFKVHVWFTIWSVCCQCGFYNMQLTLRW